MLSEGEKIDLRIVLRIFKIFFILNLFSFHSYSQIPINGFINFSEIKIYPEHRKLFSFNFNKDAYSDILVFDQEKNTSQLLVGQQNLNFSNSQRRNFPFEPNFFKPVFNQSKQIFEYAFTSRKSRVFGLMGFNQFGYPRIIKTIKLNSFPNKIDFADIDLDNSIEYLISGEAFDGLSIIYEKNNKFAERKYFRNHSFSDAYFFDINWDEYVDIVAYDLISQKLKLIYNKDGERFKVEREISVPNKVNKFQISDVNLDNYKDLTFSTDSGLIIFYGDNLNTFSESKSIKTFSSIDNFTIGDYNHDGYFDFICHSSNANYLSIIFSKNGKDFFEELIIEKNIEIYDLIPFYSKFVYGVSYILNNGKIKILSEFSSFRKDINLIYGIEPVAVKNFDYNNNGLNDFVFLDKYDNKLKFILRDNQGIPSTYYQVELKGIHKDFYIFQTTTNKISFFFYSENQRMIEILDVDFDKYNYKRDIIYTEGGIIDLWVTDNNGNGEIKLLYSKNDNLNYGILRLSLDKKYKLIKYPLVSNDFVKANILSYKEDKIIYWKKSDSLNSLKLVNFMFDTKQEKILFESPTNENSKYFLLIPKQQSDYDYFATLIDNSDKKYIVIFDQNANVITKSDLLTEYNFNYDISLIYDSEGFIYFFDDKSKKILRLVFVERTKNVVIKKVYEEINPTIFAITKLDKINKHLVYVDSSDKKIKIRQID